ncbi:anaerobic sulfatase maturase, partial [Klebsiella pneumoniae]|nr:anaerobic sulfatase maturase [Klebsiella pneumoniae]
NDLQTNGTLLDEDWARFLREHSFLVGLSIDGPQDVHDRFRITKHGEPTFDRVYGAAMLLRRHGVRFNTLTCVHRYNASRP